MLRTVINTTVGTVYSMHCNTNGSCDRRIILHVGVLVYEYYHSTTGYFGKVERVLAKLMLQLNY